MLRKFQNNNKTRVCSARIWLSSDCHWQMCFDKISIGSQNHPARPRISGKAMWRTCVVPRTPSVINISAQSGFCRRQSGKTVIANQLFSVCAPVPRLLPCCNDLPSTIHLSCAPPLIPAHNPTLHLFTDRMATPPVMHKKRKGTYYTHNYITILLLFWSGHESYHRLSYPERYL